MKLSYAVLATILAVSPSALLAQSTSTPTTAAPTTAAPTTPPMTINQRKENQQDRIAQGVKSGTLSPSETARLEHQEAGINKEERGMRAQDNGKLSAQDRKTLRQQQNQESRRIYRTKHDGKGK